MIKADKAKFSKADKAKFSKAEAFYEIHWSKFRQQQLLSSNLVLVVLTPFKWTIVAKSTLYTVALLSNCFSVFDETTDILYYL